MNPATEFLVRYSVSMRAAFNFNQYKLENWFPGHMARGLTQMQVKLKSVDCIIEVHDARIPFSGRNPDFEASFTVTRPHILVLNKMDLIFAKQRKVIGNFYRTKGMDVIFTNCKDDKNQGIKQLLPRAKELIKNSDRFNRESSGNFSLMIIGIPNVGKSSLINALRVRNLRKGGKATAVGKIPGITRSVLEKIKVGVDPLIYLYDTPGVLTPCIGSTETGLKLAVVNTLKDHLIGERTIADYLLFKLNYYGNHKYVEHLKISSPTDDINELLLDTCISNNLSLKRKLHSTSSLEDLPNLTAAAELFIRGYRDGIYGIVDIEEFDDKID